MLQLQLWKDALNELALLQVELEEKGGPSEDADLYEHILHLQKMLLKSFGLPASFDFTRIIQFENIPTAHEINIRINQLKEAATTYLLTDAKSELDILENAKANQLDPFNVLPELNIKTHIYAIFVYDKILLHEKDSLENVWHELQLTRDPEVLDFTGKLGLKEYDFERHIDYKKLLASKGLKYLEEFIESQSELLSDEDY
ncbi:MAG: hypothetical protein V4717_04930 [Bacteroidota bacterium]